MAVKFKGGRAVDQANAAMMERDYAVKVIKKMADDVRAGIANLKSGASTLNAEGYTQELKKVADAWGLLEQAWTNIGMKSPKSSR